MRIYGLHDKFTCVYIDHLKLNRWLLLGSGCAYLIWWYAVELLLPGSFNPFLGRALTVALFFGIFILSYYSKNIAHSIEFWLLVTSSLATLHYFYLFYNNKADINWVVGSYITVIVVAACLQTARWLFAYCVFTLLLSVLLVSVDRQLINTIFLPGMITILTFAYFGLQIRLKLHDQVRSKDEFISIVSHELKTPLTSIKIQTQTAKRSIEKGDPQAFSQERIIRLVDQTDRQATRLATLVEDMLDISRIASGKLAIQKERFNFSQMLTEALDSLKDLITQSKCETQLQVEPNIELYADRFRIEQLVVNLLTNAMKYGACKPIRITAAIEGRQLKMSVQDHGTGIAKEHQERIFQRFERAVTAKNISGLGLGLYICKNIVESHQGKIAVQSQVDNGATFTVTLPLG